MENHYLLIDPPKGFKREEVKIEVDIFGNIIVSGERKVGEYKFIRFRKSLKAPEKSKSEDTSARLEDGILGSIMATHVNPTTIGYRVVLKGTGRIPIVFPNETLAMNTRVQEGDDFWVTRYFPFCQIASTNSPFEFISFTTSKRKKNHPQFLVWAGRNSLMYNLRGLSHKNKHRR
ncbi:hypothetical protein P3L10_005744 [Capsicum annuum]